MTCGVFEPGFRGGGPIRSVAQIVDTVPDSVELILVTQDRDLGSSEPYPGLSGKWVDRGRSRVFYLNINSPRQWAGLVRQLRTTEFDLLYANSLWAPTTSVLPILAKLAGLLRAERVLIAPRGELAPGAMSLKSRKKKIFKTIWGWTLQKSSTSWHATADHEANHIRAAFPWAEVVIKEDQSSLPLRPIEPTMAESGDAALVFIGRIAPVKNLDITLQALRHVTAKTSLDIFGPIEDQAYWAMCQQVIKLLPRNVTVRYRGELRPEHVRETFANYDAFPFPTRGENFGHVIAESLSASCPVICPDTTPWTLTIRAGGGQVLKEISAIDLASVLQEISSADPATRHQARVAAGSAYSAWRSRSIGEKSVIEALIPIKQV